MPEEDRQTTLGSILAKSDPGVKLHVAAQLEKLLMHGPIAKRSAVEMEVARDRSLGLDPRTNVVARPANASDPLVDERVASQLTRFGPGVSALAGSIYAPAGSTERAQQRALLDLRGQGELEDRRRRARSAFAPNTLEHDTKRDPGEWQPVWDPNPYNTMQQMSPEEYERFLKGTDRDLQVATSVLGTALYELSPLADAREFVEDVRAGRYAAAAITVMMALLPAGRAFRVTHHIIAKLAKQHAELQRLMRDFGVDVDDPANLAKMVEDAHRVLHTDNYYRSVRAKVIVTRDADELRGALKDIKRQLERLKDREDSRRLHPPKRLPRS